MPGDAGDDPVFILCAGRSGSTLVRFLLDAHQDLACPPETKLPWLARQLAAAWAVIEDTPPSAVPTAGFGPASADGPDEGAVSELVAAGLRRSLDPMIESYLARRGKSRYCDKSLGTAQHAGLLVRIWPGAKFICLYRHPMDVIGSGIEASPWGLAGYGFEPYVASPPDNNVAALARYWLDYTTAIVAAEERFTDRCLPVRYEDLVTEPDHEAARMFDFIGVRPAPGIADRCFGLGHQRFGPGDYKIWNTARVSPDSVGRGWSIPATLIPAPLLDRVNELADVLGYAQVDERWGTGIRPADLRRPAAAVTAPAGLGMAEDAPRALEDAPRALEARVQAGLARLGGEFTRSHGSRATESVLLFATARSPADADAWWLLDLAAGTLSRGLGDRTTNTADTEKTCWSITGSAGTWQRVLAGEVNLGVAFRRGDLRYGDNDDAGPGSPTADRRVAMLAHLLGLAQAASVAPGG
jgi:Sulfotransferase family